MNSMNSGTVRSTRLFASNCAPCKRRKTRCDRAKPCSNCILHTCEAECYPEADGSDRSAGTSSHQSPHSQGAGTRRRGTERRSASPDLHREHHFDTSPARCQLPFPQTSTPSDGRNLQDKTFHSESAGAGGEEETLQSTMQLSLPAPALCFALVEFAGTVLGETSFLDVNLLRETASAILSDKSIPDRQACLLFWTLAFASHSVPSGHRLAKTYIDLEKSSHHWKSIALRLIASLPHSDEAADLLLDVCIHTMQATWYSSYGQMVHSWLSSGAAIRKAAALHLFDPPQTGADNHDLTLQGMAGKQAYGFLVAHRLLLIDRWMSFNNLCPMGIAREDLNIAHGPFSVGTAPGPEGTIMHISSAEKHSTRVCLEQKQVILLELGHRLRRSNQYRHGTTEQRRRDAEAFLVEIGAQHRSGEELFWKGAYLDTAPDGLQLLPIKQALPVAEWRSACAYITGVATMPFIHDPGASAYLRLASLQGACELFRVANVFTTALKSGEVALPLTRLSNQLFSAFRAVFATKVNVDLLGSESAALLGNTSTPASSSARNSSSAGADVLAAYGSNAGVPSNAQIFQLVKEGIECIEVMQSQGSAVAKRVLRLVNGAMQSHPILESGDRDSAGVDRRHLVDGSTATSIIGEQRAGQIIEPTAFDKLIEAFLGYGPGADQIAQLEHMDNVLTSFLADTPRNDAIGSVW